MSTKRLTLEQLTETEEYQRLTAKQKLFVAAYVAGGLAGKYDAAEAARIAYACKNIENARKMSYQILKSPKIIPVLNLHFQLDQVDEYLDILDRAIRNKSLSIQQLEAIRMKGLLMGIFQKIPGFIMTPDVRKDVLEPKRPTKPKVKIAAPIAEIEPLPEPSFPVPPTRSIFDDN